MEVTATTFDCAQQGYDGDNEYDDWKEYLICLWTSKSTKTIVHQNSENKFYITLHYTLQCAMSCVL